MSWDIGVEAGGGGKRLGPPSAGTSGGRGRVKGRRVTVSWDIEVTEKAEEDPAVCWDIGVAEAGAGGEEEIAEEECGKSLTPRVEAGLSGLQAEALGRLV